MPRQLLSVPQQAGRGQNPLFPSARQAGGQAPWVSGRLLFFAGLVLILLAGCSNDGAEVYRQRVEASPTPGCASRTLGESLPALFTGPVEWSYDNQGWVYAEGYLSERALALIHIPSDFADTMASPAHPRAKTYFVPGADSSYAPHTVMRVFISEPPRERTFVFILQQELLCLQKQP